MEVPGVWGVHYEAKYQGIPKWPAPDPLALREVIDIAIGGSRCATLTADGRLHLWGSQGNRVGGRC